MYVYMIVNGSECLFQDLYSIFNESTRMKTKEQDDLNATLDVLDTVQDEKSRARRARGRIREDGTSGHVANEGNGRGRDRIGPGGRTGGPESGLVLVTGGGCGRY
nr:hypothetical protein [Tanacetum cinerariifolium]